MSLRPPRPGSEIDARLPPDLLAQHFHSLAIPQVDHSKTTVAESKTTVAESKTAVAESLILESYPVETIRKLQASVETARASLLQLLRSFTRNESIPLKAVSQSVGDLVHQANGDIAATLAVLALNGKGSSREIVVNLAKHATNLSLLSIVMSILRKDAPAVSYSIGLAGLLHDSSLLLNTEWFLVEQNARDEAARKKYRRHPQESAEAFHGVVGVTTSVQELMMEVHEQADGSGYPRGMSLGKMKSGSEILNLADAYLTLTSPIQGRPIAPPDAIAYLCFHTAQGRFCQYTLRLLLESLSVYPIGSTVELDDGTKAVVIQASKNKRMAPVVRSFQPGYETIDLTNSARFISGPSAGQGSEGERLQKSRMHEFLWKTDR